MATINDIGIPGVGSGILHPKLQHKWRVTFANMGEDGTDSQPLSMQAINITRPVLTFDEVQLDRYNSRAWVAGKHTFEPVTITFEDDITGTATKVLQSQIQRQQWLTGSEGPWLCSAGEGSLYKFAVYMDMLDGCETTVERWTLEGTWISNIDYGQGDYATSDPIQITVTLRYDHARQNIGGYDRGEGVAIGGQGEIQDS